MGVSARLCGLLVLTFCLLVVEWLYQAAVLSGMSRPQWGALGLFGNVSAAALFAITRGFLRKKCPECESLQDKKATYCTICSNTMSWKCLDCDADYPVNFQFYPACGVKPEIAGTQGGENH